MLDNPKVLEAKCGYSTLLYVPRILAELARRISGVEVALLRLRSCDGGKFSAAHQFVLSVAIC